MACYLPPSTCPNVKNSDTLSEVSENGTLTSGLNSNWGSREELREFVTKHGVQDISELYQDRFRVDRRKLEQMLCGDNGALIPADVFFAKIMEDTDTYITWPNKLKLGAKSKKDPHVRIAGQPKNVEAAKERIITVLYTRCNRVTMKMDISYTDHSHIIGKGGLSIKRVMEETQCHVHFPDSNRSNPMEKSNQVSISGDLEQVENARSRVRELIPLIFGFEPPLLALNADPSHAYIFKIQKEYKVQIMFKTRSKLHSTIVLVKGVEWEVEQVKQATILLMEFMCEDTAAQTPVQLSIQISPQHHQTVLGENNSYLKSIMHATNCQVMIPDASDPNISNLKKSNVTISGNIHNVYTARQLLFGSLPLLIIFDLPQDTSNLNIGAEQIKEVQSSCDVVVTIRQKTKQLVKACIIKGVERYASNIYKARNMILGIDDNQVLANVPSSYHINPVSPDQELVPTPKNTPISPYMSPIFPWHYPPAQLASIMQKPQFVHSPIQQASSAPYQANTKTDSSILSSISSRSASPQTSKDTGPTSDYHTMSDRKMDSYDSKRAAGFKAMQSRPSPGVYRVPTNIWSGYGISHTSPAAAFKVEEDNWKTPEKGASLALNTSNHLEHTSNELLNRVTSTPWSDLPSMLISLGLERYIRLFLEHEIDLDVFATLTDKDLLAIGVAAFGTRRKLILAIAELNKRSMSFSPAPGAERKGNSSFSSYASSCDSPKNW